MHKLLFVQHALCPLLGVCVSPRLIVNENRLVPGTALLAGCSRGDRVAPVCSIQWVHSMFAKWVVNVHTERTEREHICSELMHAHTITLALRFEWRVSE